VGQVGVDTEKTGFEMTKDFYDLWLESYKAALGKHFEQPALDAPVAAMTYHQSSPLVYRGGSWHAGNC
jgi:hypothetical protein